MTLPASNNTHTHTVPSKRFHNAVPPQQQSAANHSGEEVARLHNLLQGEQGTNKLLRSNLDRAVKEKEMLLQRLQQLEHSTNKSSASAPVPSTSTMQQQQSATVLELQQHMAQLKQQLMFKEQEIQELKMRHPTVGAADGGSGGGVIMNTTAPPPVTHGMQTIQDTNALHNSDPVPPIASTQPLFHPFTARSIMSAHAASTSGIQASNEEILGRMWAACPESLGVLLAAANTATMETGTQVDATTSKNGPAVAAILREIAAMLHTHSQAPSSAIARAPGNLCVALLRLIACLLSPSQRAQHEFHASLLSSCLVVIANALIEDATCRSAMLLSMQSSQRLSSSSSSPPENLSDKAATEGASVPWKSPPLPGNKATTSAVAIGRASLPVSSSTGPSSTAALHPRVEYSKSIPSYLTASINTPRMAMLNAIAGAMDRESEIIVENIEALKRGMDGGNSTAKKKETKHSKSNYTGNSRDRLAAAAADCDHLGGGLLAVCIKITALFTAPSPTTAASSFLGTSCADTVLSGVLTLARAITFSATHGDAAQFTSQQRSPPAAISPVPLPQTSGAMLSGLLTSGTLHALLVHFRHDLAAKHVALQLFNSLMEYQDVSLLFADACKAARVSLLHQSPAAPAAGQVGDSNRAVPNDGADHRSSSVVLLQGQRSTSPITPITRSAAAKLKKAAAGSSGKRGGKSAVAHQSKAVAFTRNARQERMNPMDVDGNVQEMDIDHDENERGEPKEDQPAYSDAKYEGTSCQQERFWAVSLLHEVLFTLTMATGYFCQDRDRSRLAIDDNNISRYDAVYYTTDDGASVVREALSILAFFLEHRMRSCLVHVVDGDHVLLFYQRGVPSSIGMTISIVQGHIDPLHAKSKGNDAVGGREGGPVHGAEHGNAAGNRAERGGGNTAVSVQRDRASTPLPGSIDTIPSASLVLLSIAEHAVTPFLHSSSSVESEILDRPRGQASADPSARPHSEATTVNGSRNINITSTADTNGSVMDLVFLSPMTWQNGPRRVQEQVGWQRRLRIAQESLCILRGFLMHSSLGAISADELLLTSMQQRRTLTALGRLARLESPPLLAEQQLCVSLPVASWATAIGTSSSNKSLCPAEVNARRGGVVCCSVEDVVYLAKSIRRRVIHRMAS